MSVAGESMGLIGLGPSVAISWHSLYGRLVQAVQVQHDNIPGVVAWIRDNGGARTGLAWKMTGEVEQRHVRVTSLADWRDAHVGDWVVLEEDGYFAAMTDQEFQDAQASAGQL
jgi:hypothetical protein